MSVSVDAGRDSSVTSDGGLLVPTDDDGGSMLAPPALSIDPVTKDFSSVVTGLFVEAGFQISNSGGQPTSAPAVDLNGTHSALFSISANTCTGPLAAGSGCLVTVRFSPTSTGPKNARLNVTATLGGAVSASLQGVGVAPGALAMAPTTQSFGSILRGTESSPTSFRVTNTGDTTTGMLSASVGASSEFVIASDGCSGKPLAASAACTVSVAFAPASSGQKSGTILVSGMPGGTASAGLTGVGLAPAALSVTPATATPAGTVVGATSAAQTFTVTNLGGVTAGTTTALSVALGGANATDFTMPSSTCMGMLAGGASCAVTVAFRPSASGPRLATLTVSGTPGGSASASLMGTGLSAASLTMTPAAGSSPDFGSVVVASTSQLQTYVVSNAGQQASSALTIALTTGTGFALVVPAAGTDCVSTPAASATTLAPSATCTVRVRFTPPSPPMARTATLSVDAATGGSASLALTGTGIPDSQLSATPLTVNLGQVLQGAHSPSTSIVVTNTGGVATGALTTSLPSGEFGATDDCRGIILNPSERCTIAVTFNPTAGSGTATGTTTVTANPGGTLTMSLAGTRASLSVAPTAGSFAATNIGAISAAQTFTVTNPTGTAGTTTALSVTTGGTNAADFSVDTSTCSATLGSGLRCSATITFRPTATGNRSATLLVSASPGGATQATLTGTGLVACTAASCPAGCCRAGACVTQSNAACGTAGAACLACPSGTACKTGTGRCLSMFTTAASAFGANTLTVDPATGLRWLDVTLSTSFSYDTLLPQLGPTGMFAGYRLATQDEVFTFWSHGDVNVTDDINVFTRENFQPIESLMSLVGITGLGAGNLDNVHFFDFTSGYIQSGPGGGGGDVLVAALAADPYTFLDGRPDVGTVPSTAIETEFGAWLVATGP